MWNAWWRPTESDWARKERPTAPGWDNPVGRVKLHVTGLVFLHAVVGALPTVAFLRGIIEPLHGPSARRA